MNKILPYLTMLWLTLGMTGILSPVYGQAQGRVVTGVVRDATGPLAKATISEKGMPANIVSSGVNGEFHITLKGTSNTLIISYVNFFTQEIKIKDAAVPVSVLLKPNDKGLDEVTVIGFGNTKQRATETGAVSSINAKEIQDVPTSSVQ